MKENRTNTESIQLIERSSKFSLDVVISVRPRMFVPEADHVTQFVDENSKRAAAGSDRDPLFTSNSSDPGAAAGRL